MGKASSQGAVMEVMGVIEVVDDGKRLEALEHD